MIKFMHPERTLGMACKLDADKNMETLMINTPHHMMMGILIPAPKRCRSPMKISAALF